MTAVITNPTSSCPAETEGYSILLTPDTMLKSMKKALLKIQKTVGASYYYSPYLILTLICGGTQQKK